MKKRPDLVWCAQARADLLGIVDYISDDDPRAAQALLDEVEAKVGGLPDNPKKYALSKRAAGFRQLTVRDNYLLFYRLLGEENPLVIEIAAVVHARRQWP